MSNRQKPPRKHHYLPRFYLAGFASRPSATTKDKSTLWVYEKDRAARCSKPEAEACQKDFYTFEENGVKNFEVEKWFARLEHQIAQIIPDITASKREPTEEERTWLALFMGIMYTRTPLGRRLSDEKFGPATSRLLKEAVTDPAEFQKLYSSVDTGFTDAHSAEEVRQGILSGRSDALEEMPDFRLVSIIEIGKTVADVLLLMGWRFVYAPDGHQFITSDNPLVCEANEPGSNEIHFRTGVNVPGAGVWFPLTQAVCLLMQKGLEPGVGTTPGSTARGMNKRIMVCANRRIYAGEHSASLQRAFNRHGCKVPIESLDLRYDGKRI